MWEFHNPTRIIFGPGCIGRVGDRVAGRTLIVCSQGASARGVPQRIATMLGENVALYDGVRANPTFRDLDAAMSAVRDDGIDSILAVGGGSVIDVAKVLAIALPAGVRDASTLVDLAAGPLATQEPLPLTAVPTTAGTGSEVTPFATMWDDATKRKHSIGTPLMHPAVAVVDPELTISLPWPDTLSTGLDAFSQCFEAICNRNATPVTDAFARRGLELISPALRTLQSDPGSMPARSAMAEAALLSGLAISVTRTGLPHSMSYPLTAHFGVPHGLACAASLPFVLAFNAEADDGRLDRLAPIFQAEGPSGVAAFVLELFDELGVASAIRERLPSTAALASLQSEMVTPGRADNNSRDVGDDDLALILGAVGVWLAGKTTR